MADTTWIDANLIQKILRIAENDESIRVSNLRLKPATSAGDNYTSDMHRVTVDLSKITERREVTEELSLIFKVAPQSGLREELISEMRLFEIELSMMLETLPKMNELLKPFNTTLSARAVHSQAEKPVYIVIEDLAKKGFRMADRQAGLDLEHCLIALRNLAKFHATSVALKEKEPEVFKSYGKGMYHKDQPAAMRGFFYQALKTLANEISKWPELNPKISEKISQLCEVIYERGCESAARDENGFNVLTHGDFWVNNMMFRYDSSGKVLDHIFVDFQLPCYASPSLDLLYFLATSPSDYVRERHRDLILREYHVALTNVLASFKCKTKPPTLESLQDDMKKRVWLQYIATLTVLPTILVDKEDAKDIEEMLDPQNGIMDNPGMRSKRFKKLMMALLPDLDSRGFLDVQPVSSISNSPK